ISKAMMEKGHTRDSVQCRVKVKELRQAYQKTKEANGRSRAGPKTCRFYTELHAILGGSATTTPPLSVDSEVEVVISAMAEDSAEGKMKMRKRRTSLQKAHSTPFSPTARSFFSPRRNYPLSPSKPLAQIMKPWKRPLVSVPL
uniref:Myb/SANT-like DNA-binding domain-containing protein n=1 Tax=Gopherus agassizii TaxID=38772 RepID=A0A452H6H6_9SAUR